MNVAATKIPTPTKSLSLPGWPMKPWRHQADFLERFTQTFPSGNALWWEPGTGKTLTTIMCLRYACLEKRRLLRTLIICPSSMVYTWNREVREYSGKTIADETQVLEGKSGSQKAAHITKKVVITNADSVRNETLEKALIKFKPEVIIADELHQFKNDQTGKAPKRARALAQIRKRAKPLYFFGLTGTPSPNNGLELWYQLQLIQPGVLPKKFTEFRELVAEDRNAKRPKHVYFPCWVVTPDGARSIKSSMKEVGTSVKKKEVLDLPPLVTQTHSVTLSSKERKHYDELEEDFVTSLSETGDKCATDLVITKLLRMRQVCCGYLPDESGQIHRVGNSKQVMLEQLIDSICWDEQIIIWTCFTDALVEIDSCLKRVNRESYSVIVGGQDPKDRGKIIDDFQNGRIRTVVATQGSGGLGITLTAASYMLYYAKGFRLEHDEQSQARAYRGGSERHPKVTRWDLDVSNSVEEQIAEALKSKRTMQDFLLETKKRGGLR